jgi:hypothetical protein
MIDELRQEEFIEKVDGGYKQTVIAYYPEENIKNLKAAWTKATESYNTFIDTYDEQCKEADKVAENSVVNELEKQLENITNKKDEIDNMTTQEKLRYLYKMIDDEYTTTMDAIKKKDELIEEVKKKNRDTLESYKKQVLQDLEIKKNAILKWNK